MWIFQTWQHCHHVSSLFSAIAQMMKHSQAQFRALGNMGDVLLKTEDGASEAVAVYGRQLALAKQLRDRGFEAAAFGSLGVCHRRAGQFDKALGCHTQVRFIIRATFSVIIDVAVSVCVLKI